MCLAISIYNRYVIEKECRPPSVRPCRNPGLNQGPLDLQSNALPTELPRPAEKTNSLLPWKYKCWAYRTSSRKKACVGRELNPGRLLWTMLTVTPSTPHRSHKTFSQAAEPLLVFLLKKNVSAHAFPWKQPLAGLEPAIPGCHLSNCCSLCILGGRCLIHWATVATWKGTRSTLIVKTCLINTSFFRTQSQPKISW